VLQKRIADRPKKSVGSDIEKITATLVLANSPAFCRITEVVQLLSCLIA
jgi:hypothetical protein